MSTNFGDTHGNTLLNARRLWEVFGHRQEEVRPPGAVTLRPLRPLRLARNSERPRHPHRLSTLLALPPEALFQIFVPAAKALRAEKPSAQTVRKVGNSLDGQG